MQVLWIDNGHFVGIVKLPPCIIFYKYFLERDHKQETKEKHYEMRESQYR